jgi:hypothetical protein
MMSRLLSTCAQRDPHAPRLDPVAIPVPLAKAEKDMADERYDVCVPTARRVASSPRRVAHQPDAKRHDAETHSVDKVDERSDGFGTDGRRGYIHWCCM